MSPAMPLATESNKDEAKITEPQLQKGVKHLCDGGITRVPRKYILPIADRPNDVIGHLNSSSSSRIDLPVIDFAQLQSLDNKSLVLNYLSKASQEFGAFQLINHGIETDVVHKMMGVSKSFFELPFEEREKYMSPDMYSPVRYGTSFNQNKDGVFCWRDFLKLSCHPLSDVLPLWPSSPMDFREAVINYSSQMKSLYIVLMDAILESLGVAGGFSWKDEKDGYKEIEDGNQIMVINCYPSCPEPELTLGLPPHSDYGMLTILLQDDVEGLQIHHQGRWLTVAPLSNSFIVNIGDQLEILSNGRYKSVLHRVLVNNLSSRISVASLHGLPVKSIARPLEELIDRENPRQYKGTDFAAFLQYISSSEPKNKNFLESRKL